VIDLHPIFFSTLFTLLAIRRLLTVYRAESALSIGFDSALFLSLSIFFFPPSVILLPLPWIVFIQVRPFSLKEWIVPTTAIIGAGVYLFSFYFLGGFQFSASEYFELASEFSAWSKEEGRIGRILMTVLTIALTALGLIDFISDIPKSTLRKRSTKFIFLWVFFLTTLLFLATAFLKIKQGEEWLTMVMPMSVFMGVYFSGKGKKPKIRVVLFYLWLLATIAYMLFSN
jgi:hypothetical protein